MNAHEEDSIQSSVEKQMDASNNQSGLDFFLKSKKEKLSMELDAVEREALNRLRDKKLKVMEPKLKEIPRGYYSK